LKNVQIDLPKMAGIPYLFAIWTFFTLFYLDFMAILKQMGEKRRPKKSGGVAGLYPDADT
jgi:hypothetical protein